MLFVAIFGIFAATRVSSLRTLQNHAEFDQLLHLKEYENCDVWANKDGECVNNPRFMWSSCIGSCLSIDGNQNENCPDWTAKGECVANPNYIHINCPDSCGTPLAWSPWVRQALRIDPIHLDPELGHDSLIVPSNIADAAEIMRQRVKKYVSGYSSVVEGLTSTAPTEFLGMLGLTEALIYTLRLQELVMEYADLHDAITKHRDVITNVMQTISRGYEPDHMYKSMYHWVNEMDNSAAIIGRFLKQSEDLNKNIDLSFERVSRQFSGMHIDYGVSMPLSTSVNFLTLSNGVTMPRTGLGTWQLEGGDCLAAVRSAIENGYRFFDSAQAYRNEAEVGAALAETIASGIVSRKEIFLATKISDESFAGYENAKRLVEEQLKHFQTDYIDLYMLHSPISNLALQAETWKALEDLYAEKKIRALGVSNFDVGELEELLRVATVPPMVVQNKLDLYHIGKQLDSRGVNNLRFCMEHNIVMLAYSPFSAYPFMMQPVDDPIVRYITDKRNKMGEQVTPAQIILKWITQRGMAVIPRSSNIERQKENLEAENMRVLDAIEMTLLDLCQALIAHPFAVAVEMPTLGIE